MISNVNRSVCHLGFDSTKVYNPHQCKRKYLHSKFCYYSNTDAEFNIETNPGPSLISLDHQYFSTMSNWTDTPRIVKASRPTTIPVCINNGRYAHINHLYYQPQLDHNPLNCINISTTSTWSEISTLSQPSLHLCIMNVWSIKNKSPSLLIMSPAAKQIYLLSQKQGSAKMTILTGQKLHLLVLSLLNIRKIIVVEEELHLFSEEVWMFKTLQRRICIHLNI